jgi:hypothetical protein
MNFRDSSFSLGTAILVGVGSSLVYTWSKSWYNHVYKKQTHKITTQEITKIGGSTAMVFFVLSLMGKTNVEKFLKTKPENLLENKPKE